MLVIFYAIYSTLTEAIKCTAVQVGEVRGFRGLNAVINVGTVIKKIVKKHQQKVENELLMFDFIYLNLICGMMHYEKLTQPHFFKQSAHVLQVFFCVTK